MSHYYKSIRENFDQIEQNNEWQAIYDRIKVATRPCNNMCEIASKTENRKLNRYRDVIPFDKTRVSLRRLSNGYINANLIQVSCTDRAYILTQGPLDITVGHFWLMVWEQNSTAVVMLNRLVEKSVVKCDLYWPSAERDELIFPDLHLRVSFIQEVCYKHYIQRDLMLEDLESGVSRNVTQFHYTSWPDFGVPSSPKSFLQFLNAVRSSGALGDPLSPPVVHCSAGIGRSGTFCLVDSILHMLAQADPSKEPLPSIQDVLLEMRTQRMGLIQTAEQLRFSYIAILEGINTLLPALDPVPNGDAPKEPSEAGDGDKIKLIADKAPPPPLPPRERSMSPPGKSLTKEAERLREGSPTPPGKRWFLHMVIGFVGVILATQILVYFRR